MARSPCYAVLQSLLTARRKTSGLTQMQLGEALRKRQSFVAKYEAGERRIDVVQFIEIAEALEIDPIELFTELLEHCRQRGG